WRGLILKVRKHEDRLKKMWTDEENEKKCSGLRLVSSLFFLILRYRNKRAAHLELESTKEVLRICLESLLKAIR
ncbi:MAG: hypothetical protein QW689_07125, partial [Nitrososphaerota archaeon]